MRGKKETPHLHADDPPRRRANKRRGRGTYANDRPPIVGTVGRASQQCRLRVVMDTKGKTLRQHVHQFTKVGAEVFTDEYQSYNHILRPHATVNHGAKEWARDADGDGVREVHCNTIEGLWTDVRNFLRRFKGVHKKYLDGYLAICEFRHNRDEIAPDFIATLVASTHILCT